MPWPRSLLPIRPFSIIVLRACWRQLSVLPVVRVVRRRPPRASFIRPVSAGVPSLRFSHIIIHNQLATLLLSDMPCPPDPSVLILLDGPGPSLYNLSCLPVFFISEKHALGPKLVRDHRRYAYCREERGSRLDSGQGTGLFFGLFIRMIAATTGTG